MTPTRLRECLAALHWTQRGLAAILGCSDSLTRRWAAGNDTVPPAVATWLEALTAAHAAHPVPQDWRRPRFGRAEAASRPAPLHPPDEPTPQPPCARPAPRAERAPTHAQADERGHGGDPIGADDHGVIPEDEAP